MTVRKATEEEQICLRMGASPILAGCAQQKRSVNLRTEDPFSGFCHSRKPFQDEHDA